MGSGFGGLGGANLHVAEVRWKNLRGVFATHYLTAGGDSRNLQLIMGHATLAITLRYLRRLPAGNRERLKELASTVGQWKGRLRVEREFSA